MLLLARSVVVLVVEWCCVGVGNNATCCVVLEWCCMSVGMLFFVPCRVSNIEYQNTTVTLLTRISHHTPICISHHTHTSHHTPYLHACEIGMVCCLINWLQTSITCSSSDSVSGGSSGSTSDSVCTAILLVDISIRVCAGVGGWMGVSISVGVGGEGLVFIQLLFQCLCAGNV